MSDVSNRKILYTKPSITELEVQYATDAAANGWGDRCYEYIGRFEEAFKSYLGVKYAIATSSCTGAFCLVPLRCTKEQPLHLEPLSAADLCMYAEAS